MAGVVYSGAVVLVLFMLLVVATNGLALVVLVLILAARWWWTRDRAQVAAASAVASARTMTGLMDGTPRDFELTVRDLFNAQGFSLQHHGGSGDRGIDLAGFRPDGVPVIVQCKQYQPDRKITGPDIRSFLGAMAQHKVPHGIYVTTCSFTPEARIAAKAGGVTIVDGPMLTQMAVRLST